MLKHPQTSIDPNDSDLIILEYDEKCPFYDSIAIDTLKFQI